MRFYQALLRCYPSAFREEYGGQMQLVFDAQMDEARCGGRLRQGALWLTAARDAFTIAPREHCHVILQDIRYALRVMAAHPGFTAVAVLSLALGIGANTAIFSLWNGIANRSLPGVRDPQQLVILSNPDEAGAWHGESRGDRDLLTWQEYEQLRDRSTSFSAILASQSSLDTWPARLEGGSPEEVRGRLVSGTYFQALGVHAALGRVIPAEADRTDFPYAVISYPYWQRRFGANPDVLGTHITIRNAVLTVIGVTPPDFIGETTAQQPDLWAPIRMQPAVIPGENWLHDEPPAKMMWLHVFGRLRPGVTLARASAESNAIFKAGLETFYGGVSSLEKRNGFLDQRLKPRMAAGGASEARGTFSDSLTALLGAVGLLLLIACANLANLLLARGSTRRTELALRISLGASRGRLVRQLVTESLVLAALGGIAGLSAAWLMHGALAGLIAQTDATFHLRFSLDPAVLAFTVAVTLAAGLLLGLLPAWQVTRAGLGSTLKERGRGNTGSWGRVLVSAQLALSLPLLAGAGLLARTVYNLQHQQLGFNSERLLMLGINSRVAGYNSARSQMLFARLLEQIQMLPGVKAATFSLNGIFTGTTTRDDIQVAGFVPRSEEDHGSVLDLVGPEYFSTLGIPMVLGRAIGAGDDGAAPRVCVINESFARKFFAGRNPVGLDVTDADIEPHTTYRVAGVACDARTGGLRGEIGPRFYVSYMQPPADFVKRATFIIRTASDRTAILSAVRRAFQRVDPTLSISHPRSLEEQMLPSTAAERITARVALVFGSVALLLAAIGLYGVLAYGIARRSGEIAIRIALGARPGSVVGMILGETTWLLLAGLAAGFGLAWAASRFITSQLYGISPQDPLTLSAAVVLLLVVALVAVYLPARRASRLDPMTALRQE